MSAFVKPRIRIMAVARATRPIEQAIQLFQTKAAFCREIGMSPQFLLQIERGDRPLPPRYALKIARLPGCQLTVHDLRPDIFGPPQGTTLNRRATDHAAEEAA